jgi:hypothetical protein
VKVSQLLQPLAAPAPGRRGAWRGRRRLAAGDLDARAEPGRAGGGSGSSDRPALPGMPRCRRPRAGPDLAFGGVAGSHGARPEPHLRWVRPAGRVRRPAGPGRAEFTASPAGGRGPWLVARKLGTKVGRAGPSWFLPGALGWLVLGWPGRGEGNGVGAA